MAKKTTRAKQSKASGEAKEGKPMSERKSNNVGDVPERRRKDYEDQDAPYEDEQGETPEIIKVHSDYVRRRLEGGAPATPQAYARAMAQWQQLPGAIASLSATDLTQAQEAPTPPEDGKPPPASDMQDKEQKS